MSRSTSGAGLGPGPEFDLIRSFLGADAPRHPRVAVGPGDDCAVVVGEAIAISTDMSVEGVHFRRGWLSFHEIGYRSTTGALSDLAASAARPIGVLVSTAFTEADAGAPAVQLMQGVREAVEAVGGMLLGGDLTRSPGPLVIDVTVVGEVSAPVQRSGARPGDEVWVTGTLGGAAAAVRSLLAGVSPDPAAMRCFARPAARTSEALWLASSGAVRAMCDLSDGVAGDAAHISTASGVRIVLEPGKIPIHPAAYLGRTEAQALELALRGGEDYELLVVASPGLLESRRPEFHARFDLQLSRVGRIEVGSGVWMAADGEVVELMGAFQHFGEAP